MFEWYPEFLFNDIELSPLRFKKQPGLIECPANPFEGLPGLFADHVPDGWGRLLLRRGLEKQLVGVSEISPLDMLQYIGRRGMGALSFEPALRHGEKWAAGQIDLDRLERGIEPLLAGTPSEVLEEFMSGGASPNGIRPKIIAKEHKGRFYIGDDKLRADEWIIKFRAPEDSPNIGRIEYIYSLMAKGAGLRVPETRLFKTKKGSFFGTKRFDRNVDGRLHMHTLSGILHASPTNFSVGYDEFAKVTSALTGDIREVRQVIRIAAFNILACNQDDHSRNVAFLMDAAGKWQVAPAYDLTFHRTRAQEHKMALRGTGKPTEEDLWELAREFGISKVEFKTLIEKSKSAISQFSSHARAYDLSKRESAPIQSSLELALMRGKKASRALRN